MCDNLQTEMASLAAKRIRCSKARRERWESITHIEFPGGGSLGLYEPTHPTAISGAHKPVRRTQENRLAKGRLGA